MLYAGAPPAPHIWLHIWPALPQCGLRSRACILGSALWGRRSGVCTGGRLFGALGLVDGILARPVRDELLVQERADGGELLRCWKKK